jgi:tRNA-binding EMAP/Myf-like protein
MFLKQFAVLRRQLLPNLIKPNNYLRFQTTSATTATSSITTPNILDLRVGYIKDIRKHENADSLYVSQIQIGPDADKDIVQVCSGLVGLIPMEKLYHSRVVVVNNLKPSKMRGIKSEAMLLCADATNTDGQQLVDPVLPPSESPLGAMLTFGAPAEEVSLQNKKRLKSKEFMEVAQDLTVNNEWVVMWRNCALIGCTVGLGNPAFFGAQVR